MLRRALLRLLRPITPAATCISTSSAGARVRAARAGVALCASSSNFCRQRCCRAAIACGGDAASMSSTDDAGADAGGAQLRMLCLHGFLQNSEVLRVRIGSMRKALKSRVDFCFADAPFHAASTLTEQQIREVGGSSDGLTWFQWEDLGPGKRPSLAVKYSNWEATYACLCDALRREAPDGIFGFSQGATAAALFLAALAQAQRDGRDTDVPLPRFAIVVAGFLPRDPEYAGLLEQARCSVPALFVVGEADGLIPPDRSAALMATWDAGAAELLTHAGAHMVPTCSGDVKQRLAAFLDRHRGGAPAART